MQSISELLRSEKDASGLSYRDLVERASKAGYSLKFQYVNELVVSGPKSWPKNPDTFRALAAILRVSEKSVVLAYAASLGLDVTDSTSPFATRLPAGTEKLSPSMQDALIAVVRAATQEEGDGNVSTAPITRAGESPAPSDEATQDDVDLAAYDTGRESQGRRLRRLQDEAAEAGGGA
ncbi:hypothetical protein ACFOD8_08270 [Arthrobacter agilis]|nr:hypothetical protein [Arthrobacter agilis]